MNYNSKNTTRNVWIGAFVMFLIPALFTPPTYLGSDGNTYGWRYDCRNGYLFTSGDRNATQMIGTNGGITCERKPNKKE